MPKTTAEAFEALIATFVSTTRASSEAARECANIALTHFHDHGDGCYLDRFLEVLEEKGSSIKDYVRKDAFVKWAVDHAPLTRVKGKFVKDKTPNANRWQLKKALDRPFWLYASVPPTARTFTADQFIAGLKQFIERHEDGAKFKPDNAATAGVVKLGHKMVEDFALEAKKAEARLLLKDELDELKAAIPPSSQAEATDSEAAVGHA